MGSNVILDSAKAQVGKSTLDTNILLKLLCPVPQRSTIRRTFEYISV